MNCNWFGLISCTEKITSKLKYIYILGNINKPFKTTPAFERKAIQTLKNKYAMKEQRVFFVVFFKHKKK